MHSDIRDLFDGHAVLGRVVNTLFNTLWDDILLELRQPIFDNLAIVYKHWLTTLLDAVPYEHFFIQESTDTHAPVVEKVATDERIVAETSNAEDTVEPDTVDLTLQKATLKQAADAKVDEEKAAERTDIDAPLAASVVAL